jgi:DNA polymerase-3 subunit beta
VFARESSNIVRLKVEPGVDGSAGRVGVRAVSAETGDNDGAVDAEVVGDVLEIGFNNKYVLDTLGALAETGAKRAKFEFTLASSPCKVTPFDAASGVWSQHVLMPMSLGGR